MTNRTVLCVVSDVFSHFYVVSFTGLQVVPVKRTDRYILKMSSCALQWREHLKGRFTFRSILYQITGEMIMYDYSNQLYHVNHKAWSSRIIPSLWILLFSPLSFVPLAVHDKYQG